MENNINERTKSQDLIALKNILFEITQDVIPWKYSEKLGSYNMVSGYPSYYDLDTRISTSFQWEPQPYKEKNKKNRIQYKLQKFRDALNKWGYHKELILCVAKYIINRQQWRFVDYGGTDIRFMEPNAKGNSRYNKRLNGKILDRLREFGAQDMDCVFLTQTCDPAKYGNIAAAWENFYKEEVAPVWEPLRKHYGAIKVSVMESTKKGYPHIHNLIFFPKGTFPELAKLKNGTKLKYGKLYNFVKSRVYSRIFDIKTVSGEHKIFYLNKYLKKGIECPIREITKKDLENISDAEIKLLNEFVFLTAFGKRKVLMSQSKNKNSKSLDVTADVSVSQSEAKETKSSLATKWRAALNSICDNSPLARSSISWGIPYRGLMDSLKHSKGLQNADKEQFFNYFQNLATYTVNSENFYSLLVKFIQNPHGNPLNKGFYVKGYPEKLYHFTDFYNLNNDEDFILCIKHLVRYYWRYCIRYNIPLKTVCEQYSRVIPKNGLLNRIYNVMDLYPRKKYEKEFQYSIEARRLKLIALKKEQTQA